MIYMYHFWYYPYTNSGIHTKNGTNKPIGLLQDTHFVCTKYYLVRGKAPNTPFRQSLRINTHMTGLQIKIYFLFADLPYLITQYLFF